MSFNWKDYVYLAEELLNREEESYLRSSISRAYYGVFCILRDKAGLINYRPRVPGEPGVHEKVIQTYKDSVDRKEATIGQTLDQMRKSRNRADYVGEERVRKESAERAVKKAVEILKALGGSK